MPVMLLIMFFSGWSLFGQNGEIPGPKLPLEVAAEVKTLQETVARALSSLTSKKVAQDALPAAERAHQLRLQYQGDDWWETVDRRVELEVLQRAASLPAESEKLLGEAFRLEQEAGLAKAPLTEEKALRQLATLEAEIYGEESAKRATTLDKLGSNLHFQGNFGAARQLYIEALAIQRRVTGKKSPGYVGILGNLAWNFSSQGEYGGAEQAFAEALGVQLEVSGEQHPHFAVLMCGMALSLQAEGKYSQSETLMRGALNIHERVNGNQHPDYADTLGYLANNLRLQERYAEAETMYREALGIQERTTGKQHQDYALTLIMLAGALENQEKHEEAEPLFREALGIVEKVTDRRHPDFADALSKMGANLEAQGKHGDAEPLFKEALEILDKVNGKQHPYYAEALSNLTANLETQGKHRDAQPLLRAALEIQEKATGKKHPHYAEALNHLAENFQYQGKYLEAEPLLRMTLEIELLLTGKQHQGYTNVLRKLAGNLRAQGKHLEAGDLFREALEIQERVTGKQHLDYVANLCSLALNTDEQGKHREAETLFREALKLQEALSGKDHENYETILTNLALTLSDQAKYGEAQPLFREALEIHGRIKGKERPDYATKLNSLAVNLGYTGQHEKAESLHREALTVLERANGKQNPFYATFLGNLAMNLQSQGKYREAEPLHREAMEIQARATGKQHEEYALLLSNLAMNLQSRGKYGESELLYRESLSLLEKVRGKKYAAYASILNNLAYNLGYQQGKYSEAEPLYREALAIEEGSTRKQHTGYYVWQSNLGQILARDPAHHAEASRLLVESSRGQRILVGNAVTMTVQEQRVFSKKRETTRSSLPSTLGWNLSAENRRLVVEELLLSFAKRNELDRHANLAMRRVLPTAPDWWLKIWDEHEALRRAIAAQAFRGVEADRRGEASLNMLIDQLDHLEKKLREYEPFSQLARLEEVGLRDITQALKPGQLAVQLSLYTPIDFASDRDKRWGEEAYLALILRPGQEPTHVSLSSKNVIEAAVRELQRVHRACIDGTKIENADLSEEWWQDCEKKVAAAGSKVRELIWDPLKKHWKDSRRLYLAAGGLLGLVPFEMLPEKQVGGSIRYLAEDREFIYLNSLRELGLLSRRRDPVTNRTAVVVANPHFDATAMELAQKGGFESPKLATARRNRGTLGGSLVTGGSLRTDLRRNWDPIDSAQFANEAVESLKKNGWKVYFLTGIEATEEAVTSLKAPRLLQIATHGYVLDPPKDQPEQSPLLRSMLMLAGVNKSADGEAVYRIGQEYLTEEKARARNISDEELSKAKIDMGDGVLTAYEAQGMNLFGTELVNLTACETGLGAVNSDGIAGLRQAFMNAGARSITMSLFEIPQLESTKQMGQFYDNWLSRKMTRYEAFRAAQLQALESARKNEKTGHPFLWAGIVFYGDPGDLPSVTK
jgi:tetratricopeptide (TPR) repeat protein/CHAT domain-containing protein